MVPDWGFICVNTTASLFSPPRPRLALPALASEFGASLGRGGENPDIDPLTEVTVTVGATQGLYAAAASLVDPGDEVILFEVCRFGSINNFSGDTGLNKGG